MTRTFLPTDCIVVVDDDDAVRDSVGILLETHGFHVRNFASGAEFLSSDVYKIMSCLLIDYHMPDMTGLEVVEELQRLGRSYPTILITGLADDTIIQRALSAGIMAILEKPPPDDVLIDTVLVAVNGARRAARDQQIRPPERHRCRG
jgi:two-component system, LuxR family, response regulator FixJ